MSKANAYGNYLKQEVEGATQGQLIVMLYDAAIRFMRNGIKGIEEKHIENAHNNIIKAEEILYELMSTLNTDEGGEIADHLLRLYDFMIWTLIEANTSKSIDKINEVLKLMIPLRDAWKEALAKEAEVIAREAQTQTSAPSARQSLSSQPQKPEETSAMPPKMRLNISG